MHLEVFKGESGIWFIRLVGGNGETIMVSEGYDQHFNATRAASDISGVSGFDVIQVDSEDDDDSDS